MATTADNVAAYILKSQGGMTAMKLQKLCYYSHAWHLVWEEAPLFHDRIEAWANGPVIPTLYRQHRGEFRVETWPNGDPTQLTEDQTTSIDAVLETYSRFTAHQLSEMTHQEDPWRDARRGLPDGERSQSPILDAALAEYYDARTQAAPVGA